MYHIYHMYAHTMRLQRKWCCSRGLLWQQISFWRITDPKANLFVPPATKNPPTSHLRRVIAQDLTTLDQARAEAELIDLVGCL